MSTAIIIGLYAIQIGIGLWSLPETGGSNCEPLPVATIVIANGELPVQTGERVRLGFMKRGDDYGVWNDGRLIATYRKEGGYPGRRIQLRLTNAQVTIHKLEVRTLRGRQQQNEPRPQGGDR